MIEPISENQLLAVESEAQQARHCHPLDTLRIVALVRKLQADVKRLALA